MTSWAATQGGHGTRGKARKTGSNLFSPIALRDEVDGQPLTAKMALLWLFFTLLLAINSALSARIAGFCAIGGSHYINTRNTLEELASRGHEVKKNFCTAMLNHSI